MPCLDPSFLNLAWNMVLLQGILCSRSAGGYYRAHLIRSVLVQVKALNQRWVHRSCEPLILQRPHRGHQALPHSDAVT